MLQLLRDLTRSTVDNVLAREVVGKIGEETSGLLDDPSWIWNMDEMAVDATYGKAPKSYGPNSSKQGG